MILRSITLFEAVDGWSGRRRSRCRPDTDTDTPPVWHRPEKAASCSSMISVVCQGNLSSYYPFAPLAQSLMCCCGWCTVRAACRIPAAWAARNRCAILGIELLHNIRVRDRSEVGEPRASLPSFPAVLVSASLRFSRGLLRRTRRPCRTRSVSTMRKVHRRLRKAHMPSAIGYDGTAATTSTSTA